MRAAPNEQRRSGLRCWGLLIRNAISKNPDFTIIIAWLMQFDNSCPAVCGLFMTAHLSSALHLRRGMAAMIRQFLPTTYMRSFDPQLYYRFEVDANSNTLQ
jgi:hypothetical protein